MIREIFVPLLRATSDDTAIDTALAIARVQGDACVTALITLVHPMPIVTAFGYIPVEADQRFLDGERAQAAELAGKTRARLERESTPSQVRITEAMALWSEETAALQALHCDLSVIGRPGPGQLDGSPRFSLTFRSLLLHSGRPVIVVPPDAPPMPAPARRGVLAWKPTAESTRAQTGSLPLLAPNAPGGCPARPDGFGPGSVGAHPGLHRARPSGGRFPRACWLPSPRTGSGRCPSRRRPP